MTPLGCRHDAGPRVRRPACARHRGRGKETSRRSQRRVGPSCLPLRPFRKVPQVVRGEVRTVWPDHRAGHRIQGDAGEELGVPERKKDGPREDRQQISIEVREPLAFLRHSRSPTRPAIDAGDQRRDAKRTDCCIALLGSQLPLIVEDRETESSHCVLNHPYLLKKRHARLTSAYAKLPRTPATRILGICTRIATAFAPIECSTGVTTSVIH